MIGGSDAGEFDGTALVWGLALKEVIFGSCSTVMSFESGRDGEEQVVQLPIAGNSVTSIRAHQITSSISV